MSDPRFRIEPLGKVHDRAAFSCGVDTLDRYLHQQAGQDVRNAVAAVYVLRDTDVDSIAGYYTLSATSILLTDLPAELARKLPRYPTLPAILLGRLAVDRDYQGQGWGRRLLLAALQRAHDLSEQLGAMAVIVDAKDDAARDFYERYGFLRFTEDEHRLFIRMQQIAQL